MTMRNEIMIIFILLALLVILCAVLLVLLFRSRTLLRELFSEPEKQLLSISEDLEDLRHDINESVPSRVGEIRVDIDRRLRQDADENRKNRIEISEALDKASEQQRLALDRLLETQQRRLSNLSEAQQKRLSELSESQNLRLSRMTESQNSKLSEMSELQNSKLSELSESQQKRLSEYQQQMQEVLKGSLSELSEHNREKLSEIQSEINKKLDTSLNERLDASFKTVGEQLNKLYTSLGELSRLEDDVTNLNRTLSNVKTRGIFGETQLESILADILPQNLYDKNVVTKKSVTANRDAVEFAIKIPDKEASGEFLYLPIDSKFPGDIYGRIIASAENADTEGLNAAVKELEQFIKREARSIEEKYIDPPGTTDFALMFLPTESLYAEVLRIPGLSEECQRRHHIVITGPSTLSALLSSLNIGFRYMAVNRDSKNILKLLSAIKTQYATLSKLITTANSRIELAGRATQDLQKRTDIINKKLSRVEELDPVEAKELLGLKDNGPDEDEEPEA